MVISFTLKKGRALFMCLICDRIEMIKRGDNPYFVKELETGYVVIGDFQHFKGYTLFLCKQHKTELFYLDKDYKLKFLEEMSIVTEAVYKAFGADKMNCELLGNGDSHLHWHLFPRYNGDLAGYECGQKAGENSGFRDADCTGCHQLCRDAETEHFKKPQSQSGS